MDQTAGLAMMQCILQASKESGLDLSDDLQNVHRSVFDAFRQNGFDPERSRANTTLSKEDFHKVFDSAFGKIQTNKKQVRDVAFNPNLILQNLESLRYPNGAFIAAPTDDYRACWIRDHLYANLTYYYTEDYPKLVQGIWVVWDILHQQKYKLERKVHPRDEHGNLIVSELIHAKYDPQTLKEVTPYWGHHQLDAIGLFLWIIATVDKKVTVFRNAADQEILRLLVRYLETVRYWEDPDFGLWEECRIKHSSSIGAVVAGLKALAKTKLVSVPDWLIEVGSAQLKRILPFESRDCCANSRHQHENSHDCDVAQLFLIWPFNVLDKNDAEVILKRVIFGHTSSSGHKHKLAWPLGIQRYWGDEYLHCDDWTSALWQYDFLVAIIYAQQNDYEESFSWFRKGAKRITPDGYIAEAMTNRMPNKHTPLGWMHALALIAFLKLPQRYRSMISLGTSHDLMLDHHNTKPVKANSGNLAKIVHATPILSNRPHPNQSKPNIFVRALKWIFGF